MEKQKPEKLPDYGRMEDIMIREGLEQGIVAIVIGGISIGAILLRLILSENYRRLVRASNSMMEVKKKWLRQLKKKFEKMYQVGVGVHNVSVFVDKYLNQRRILGLYLSTWESVNKQALLLCATGVIGVFLAGIYYNLEQTIVLPTIAVGICGMALIQLIDNFCCLEEKKKQLSRNLIYYFENYSKVKLEQQSEEQDGLGFDSKSDWNKQEEEELIRNEEAAPALAEDIDFVAEDKEVTVQPVSRREKRAKRKQEKLYLKQEEKEQKRLQKEQIQNKEDSLEETQKRREEKQRQRKQRALEELKHLKETETQDSKNKQTFEETKPQPMKTVYNLKQNTILSTASENKVQTNMMKPKDQTEPVQAARTVSNEESAAGEENCSPEEEIMRNLNLDSLNQTKKQDNKEQDKLIEEVLKEFLE